MEKIVPNKIVSFSHTCTLASVKIYILERKHLWCETYVLRLSVRHEKLSRFLPLSFSFHSCLILGLVHHTKAAINL